MSSRPATLSTASRSASASSRRRFCRQRKWLPPSIFANAAIVCGGLPVGGAGDDQPVQLLERAGVHEFAAVAELGGEPVEQLRVRRQRAHPAEVVRRLDDPPAEVVVPDAVDDRPPRQRVPLVDDPLRQRGAALRLVMAFRQVEPRRQLANAPTVPGPTSCRAVSRRRGAAGGPAAACRASAGTGREPSNAVAAA